MGTPRCKQSSTSQLFASPIVIFEYQPSHVSKPDYQPLLDKLNQLKNAQAFTSQQWSFQQARENFYNHIEVNVIPDLAKTSIYKNSLIERLDEFERYLISLCIEATKLMPCYKYGFYAYLENFYEYLRKKLILHHEKDCVGFFNRRKNDLENSFFELSQQNHTDILKLPTAFPEYKRDLTERIKKAISTLTSVDDCQKCYEEMKKFIPYFDYESNPQQYFMYNSIPLNTTNYWQEITDHVKKWIENSISSSKASIDNSDSIDTTTPSSSVDSGMGLSNRP